MPASSIPRAPATPQFTQAPGMPASPAYLSTANPPSNRSSAHTPPPPPRAAPPPFDAPAQPGHGAPPPLPPAYASPSNQGPPASAEDEDEDLKRALEESAREAARSALPPRPGTGGGDADSIGGRGETPGLFSGGRLFAM